MRIFIIRHGDPDYANDTITPTGQREAQVLAEHLAETGLDELYSSPLGRAQATAQYTAEKLGLPVTIEPWARELKGMWLEDYRRAFWDLDGPLLRSAEITGALNHWQAVPPLNQPVLAENYEVVRQGSEDFLARQGFMLKDDVYTVERENRKKIAIFMHLGSGLTWLSHLLAIPLPLMWAGFFLPTTSVTTLLLDERTPGCALPRCLGVGDVSHLARAGLRPSRAGIIANAE
jgi:broad specificity phosphatase PhoE